MSDETAAPEASTPPPPGQIPTDARTLPIIVYALYILACVNGVTALIGFGIALASREAASPEVRSHYRFQIRTFFGALILGAAGAVCVIVGIPLLLILVGALIIKLGIGLFAFAGLYLLARAVIGLVRLVNGEAYPTPDNWIV